MRFGHHLHGGLVSLIAVIGAIVLALFYNGLYTTLYALSGIAMAVALAAAVFWPGATARFDPGPAGVTLLTLCLWSLLGLAWSTVPYLTSIQTGTLGAAAAAYIVARITLPDTRARVALALGLIVLGVVFALVMIAQFGLGERPEGAFLNVNSAAAFVNLLWPLPAAVALHPALQRRNRVLLLVITGVMVFAVGITGGRAVVLALIAALVVLLIGGGCWVGRRRLVPVATTVVAALAAAHTCSRIVGDGAGRVLGHRLAELADASAAGASRLRIWDATLTMIAERPWLGWGPGTFHQAYPAFRHGRDGSAGQQVHNDYLQYWVDGGLPAIMLLLTLTGIVVWLFLRGLRQSACNATRCIMWLAASASLAGTGVHALFSYNLQMMAYLIVLGIALAALEFATAAPGLPGPSPGAIRRRRLRGAAFLLLLAIPAVHMGTVAASHHYTVRGVNLLQQGRYEAADDALARAVRFWDAQDIAPGLRADARRRALQSLPEARTARRERLKRSAEDWIERALNRNPLRSLHYLTRARIRRESPDVDPEGAIAAYRQALARNPRTADARIELAQLLRQRGDDREALRVVNAGFGRHYSRSDPIPLMRLGVRLREEAGDQAGADRLRRQLREHQAPSDEPANVLRSLSAS